MTSWPLWSPRVAVMIDEMAVLDLPHSTGGLEAALRRGDFALTAETSPPDSTDPAEVLQRVRALKGLADAVNVTDGAGARTTMASLAATALMARDGIEPVLQFTMRDRNRLALQADLLGASALGIANILCLHGDDVVGGDQPDAKPVFDLETGDFIAMVREMSEPGRLPSGREIDSPPKLFLGAADTPIDPEPGWRPTSLLRKIDAGSQFVQTQLCFDIDVVRRYAARLEDAGLMDRVYLLIGFGPLASARSARWMRDNLRGVIVPDHIIDRLEKAEDQKAEGIRICAELIEQLQEVGGVSGAHMMAPGNIESIPRAVQEAGVRRKGRYSA